ncbi:MAG: hypothetical protein NVSMB34_12120 [Variovorax sp.]
MKFRYLPVGLLALAALHGTPSHADATVDRGREVFKQCEGCHSVVPGETRYGPSLAGIVDRPAGRLQGYDYSDALRGAKFKWDAKHLTQWLADEPKNMVPGTRMEYPGMANAADLQALIAYLGTVKSR